MAADMVPRYPGYVSVTSRRYNEWQTLVFEATTEQEKELPPEYYGPLVDHPPYPTPKKIIRRPKEKLRSTDSPIRQEEIVPRVEPLQHDINKIEEKGGGDQVPERPMNRGETNKDRYTDHSHDGSRDMIDDLQVDHRSTSERHAYNMI